MEVQRQMQRVQLPTGVIWAEVEQIGDVPLRRDVSTQEEVPPQSIEVVREAIKGLGRSCRRPSPA